MDKHAADGVLDDYLVSVIMPVFNAQDFIGQAIESVLGQTFHNLELLVIDDCSTDSSVAAAKSFQARDSRVSVFQLEENSGVANARNIGISICTGDYVALIDSDDVWEPEKIERQLFLARETGADLVYCSYGFIDDMGNPLGDPFIVPRVASFESMLVSSVISCSTAMIKRESIGDELFDDSYYHEDYVFWMKLLRKGCLAVGDQAVLAHYRQLEGSRSSAKLTCARYRWDAYRRALGLSVGKSALSFAKYAANGAKKYWPRRLGHRHCGKSSVAS